MVGWLRVAGWLGPVRRVPGSLSIRRVGSLAVGPLIMLRKLLLRIGPIGVIGERRESKERRGKRGHLGIRSRGISSRSLSIGYLSVGGRRRRRRVVGGLGLRVLWQQRGRRINWPYSVIRFEINVGIILEML